MRNTTKPPDKEVEEFMLAHGFVRDSISPVWLLPESGPQISIDHDAATFFCQARKDAVAEAEIRGRDNIITELVQGWSGLADDIETIQNGAKSLSRKTSALATRLSVLTQEGGQNSE